MTAPNYPTVLAETLRHEGGWADHPNDPGGATMRGITIGTYRKHKGRTVSKAELRAISDSDVQMIYAQGYWVPVRGDDLPAGLDMVAFDGAVNSGVSRGSRWLQAALDTPADGVIGRNTIAAAQAAPNRIAVIQRACSYRMGFLRGLRTWGTFGRGWTRRVASVEATAVAMAGRSADRLRAESKKADGAARGQAKGAAGTVGASAGTSYGLDVLPDIATYGLLAAGLIVALVLVSKSRVNKERARAYARKALELIT